MFAIWKQDLQHGMQATAISYNLIIGMKLQPYSRTGWTRGNTEISRNFHKRWHRNSRISWARSSNGNAASKTVTVSFGAAFQSAAWRGTSHQGSNNSKSGRIQYWHCLSMNLEEWFRVPVYVYTLRHLSRYTHTHTLVRPYVHTSVGMPHTDLYRFTSISSARLNH